MCGIGGIFGSAARRDRAARMLAALRHRGPDDEGLSGVDGTAVVAACRLSVTGPGPSGAQPLWDATGRYCLVFNGEIYDHLDLRARLPGRRWTGGSDTETLLHALAAWGEPVLADLEGIFALAFLDMAAGELLLARDRLGVKPLYLARHGGSVYFASEAKALLAAGVPADVHTGVLRASLAHYWVNGSDTPLRGVERLLPGTVARVTDAGRTVRARPWFRLASMVDGERERRLAQAGREHAAGTLHDTLRAAVRRRLPPDSDAGVLCSGGLDSSLVLALAARESAPLPAFVARFPGDPGDETAWAARACEATGSELVGVLVDAPAWREHFVRCVGHFEYPMVHHNAVALAIIARRARACGLKVLLSGEGADELLGGYPSRHHKARLAFAHELGVEPVLEVPSARRAALADALGHRPWPAAAAYEEAERDALRDAYGHQSRARRELSAVLAGDLRAFLSHGLNRLDKNLMQHAVEVREPFLDTRVVGLSLDLPLEHRLLPEPKGVLRDVARRYLPPDLVDRPKWGFDFGLGEHLRLLRPGALAGGLLRDALGVPAGAWSQLVATLEGKDAFRAWSAEIWCRLFLAGDAPDDVDAQIWT